MGKRKKNHAPVDPTPYSRLPHRVYDSAAFRALDPYEQATLLYVLRAHNGHNNGQITASVRKICDQLHCSEPRAMKSLRALQAKGFLKCHYKACYEGSKQGRASEWEITWLPMPIFGGASWKAPSDEWQRWTPGTDYPVIRGPRPANAFPQRNEIGAGANQCCAAHQDSAQRGSERAHFDCADTGQRVRLPRNSVATI